MLAEDEDIQNDARKGYVEVWDSCGASQYSDCFLSYFVKNIYAGVGVVAYSFNPSTRRQRQMSFDEFKTNLVSMVSSRTARNA